MANVPISCTRASKSADDDRPYPHCLAGEGGVPRRIAVLSAAAPSFFQVIADPDHEEDESTLRWTGGHFDPDAFDSAAVKFDDPKKRWKKAFGR